MAHSLISEGLESVTATRKKPQKTRKSGVLQNSNEDHSKQYLLKSWGRYLDYFWQKTIISPLFLFASLVIFLFVPDHVIKDRLWNGFRRSFKMSLKRGLDILVAIMGIAVGLPFFLIIPFLIKLDSRGPVFYRQLRIGRNRRQGYDLGSRLVYRNNPMYFDRRKVDFHGQTFYLTKFRTMQHNAELMTGPVWASANDPRVTRVGRILRATHFDELPQFFNVLKGEMSIVGPRPERPCFVTEFAGAISDYTSRFKVKPGITGSAQIYNGYDTCLKDVKEKLDYELDYIEKGTFWSDIKLIFLTLLSMLKGEGGRKISKKPEN